MKVLVIGNGGREHALAWKAAQSPLVETVFVAPGNAGTALEPALQNVAIGVTDIPALLDFAQNEKIDLTIVGPEAPLVKGVVDTFRAAGLKIFGPTAGAAQLEGSKAFTKDFLARHKIPTAEYQNFTEVEPALAYLREKGAPIVIKADGLAAGKGVIVAMTLEEAEAAVHDMLAGNAFGDAGHRIVIEEFLDGEEASFIVMVDGEHVLPMATSQDHKRVGDKDTGPNTGGMGAYSPAPVVTDDVHQRTMERIIWPTVKGMAAEGNTYTGFLYAGLMIDKQGNPKVIEFNCRFGDPETQPIMLRMKSDLVELCLAACEGKLDEKTSEWDERASLGVVMAAGGYPGDYRTGDVIHGLPLEEVADGKVFHAGTKLADDEQVVTNGGRVLCVTALGHTVAEAQKRGGIAAFIDAEHALDPVYAKNIGVDTENLLISQPDNGEQALEVCDALVRSGAVDMIVVDSVAALTPRAEIEGEMGDTHVGLLARLMSQALRKLTANIGRTNTVVIFINQIREKIGVLYGNPETTTGGRALKFYSSVRLEVRRGEAIKKGNDIVGNRTKVKVVKNKVAPPFRTCEFDILYGEGISNESSLIDIAAEMGVLEKSGSWYSYKGERLGQGRDNVRIYLREHPEMAQEIDQRVRGVAVDEEPEKKEEALLQENMNALLDDDFLADVDDEL